MEKYYSLMGNINLKKELEKIGKKQKFTSVEKEIWINQIIPKTIALASRLNGLRDAKRDKRDEDYGAIVLLMKGQKRVLTASDLNIIQSYNAVISAEKMLMDKQLEIFNTERSLINEFVKAYKYPELEFKEITLDQNLPTFEKNVLLSDIPMIETKGDKHILVKRQDAISLEDKLQELIPILNSSQFEPKISTLLRTNIQRFADILATEIIATVDEVDENANIYIIMDCSEKLAKMGLIPFHALIVLTIVKSYILAFKKFNYNRQIIVIRGDKYAEIHKETTFSAIESLILDSEFNNSQFYFIKAYSELFNNDCLKSDNPLTNCDKLFVIGMDNIDFDSIIKLENEESENYHYSSTRIDAIFNMTKKWNIDLNWIQYYEENTEESFFTNRINLNLPKGKTFTENILNGNPNLILMRELMKLKEKEKILMINRDFLLKGLSLFDFEKFFRSKIQL